MINDSNNTHYVVHILTAPTALASGLTAQWEFSLISCFTASQHSSFPQTDEALLSKHKFA